MELLIRDRWGLGDRRPDEGTSEEDLALLDRIAALTLAGVHSSNPDEAFSEMRSLYETDDRLRVPPIVTCYCYDGSIIKIDLIR